MTKHATKKWTGNVRDAALTILLAVDKNQAYSNLLLHQTIEGHQIDARDRKLLTELTYGTLQRKDTLRFYLAPFQKGKLEKWVEWLLLLSIYQIVYLDRVPNHAIVNEAVEIAKKRGHKGIATVVNGILRSILRQGVRSTATISDEVERLAIETSHPEWLIARWIEQFGYEQTKNIATANNEPAYTTVRVNVSKTSVEDVMHSLETEGIRATKSDIVPFCLRIEEGQVAKSQTFLNGDITIQDESSMLPVLALNVQENVRILDMCAAPGGKSTHIAERLNNTGTLLAVDIHAHKVKLIKQQMERLHLNNIETLATDSRKLLETMEKESFDRILLDAPCSGFGVIRRKPDIKYTKQPDDITGLTTIQAQLLDAAYTLLKEDGILVYSTCTIERQENNEMVEQFLIKHSDMELYKPKDFPLHEMSEIGFVQIFPQDFNSDGFFIAAFRKKGGSSHGSNSKN